MRRRDGNVLTALANFTPRVRTSGAACVSREWPPTQASRQPEAAPARRLPLAEQPRRHLRAPGGRAWGALAAGVEGVPAPTSERFRLAMELEPTGVEWVKVSATRSRVQLLLQLQATQAGASGPRSGHRRRGSWPGVDITDRQQPEQQQIPNVRLPHLRLND
ncbi:unnamed protein product [Lampetra planeri]